MNQDDQRYTLMAAAAAAAYAQKKARRAVLLSQALSQNMSLDPKVQEELKRLLQEETRRVGQENFDWQLGWTLAVIVFGGLFVLLFGGALLTTCSSSHSYTPSAATYITSTPEPTATATPEPAATPVEVRRGCRCADRAMCRPMRSTRSCRGEQMLSGRTDSAGENHEQYF